MPNVCTTCKHPDLKAINIKLVRGETLSSISKEYNISEASIFRHKTKHLPSGLTTAFKATQMKNNSDLVKMKSEIEETKLNDSFDIMKKIDFLVSETEDLYAIARKGDKNLLALRSLDSLRGHYQLLINISAQLHANRVLELELLKLKNSETDEEEKREYEQNLEILSFEELKVLQRLTDKIYNQTDELIILDGKVFGWETMFFGKEISRGN